MNAVRACLLTLVLAIFAMGQAWPVTAAPQDAPMMMDHGTMSMSSTKGLADLCKAHCEAITAVLPLQGLFPQPDTRPAAIRLAGAIRLPSRSPTPEGPPPRA